MHNAHKIQCRVVLTDLLTHWDFIHNYFAKEHGWLITGLEPHGMQLKASEVHEVSILQDKAPLLVENLLRDLLIIFPN